MWADCPGRNGSHDGRTQADNILTSAFRRSHESEKPNALPMCSLRSPRVYDLMNGTDVRRYLACGIASLLSCPAYAGNKCWILPAAPAILTRKFSSW